MYKNNGREEPTIHHIEKISGKKYLQESIPLDLRGISCYQSNLLCGLNYIALMSVVALSGCLSGLFSAYGSYLAFTGYSGYSYADSLVPQIILFFILLLASYTWIWNSIYYGLSNSLLKWVFIIGVPTLIAALSMRSPRFIAFTTFLSLPAIGIVAFAFLGGVFSLFLVDSLSKKQTPLVKKIAAISVVIIAVFISYLLNPDVPKESSSFQNEYVLLKLLLGGITGSMIASASMMATSSAGKMKNYFKFLKVWAIALAAYGGTSFYNLDLSHVDFSGANLANSDFRASTLYRTILKDVTGLDLARIDSRYLDLENYKVQQLLTKGDRSHLNFQRVRLQGAYLQAADLREFDFTDANLTGADLSKTDIRQGYLTRTQAAGVAFQQADLRNSVLVDANLTEADFQDADLRGSILVRAQVARANFARAELTGICIEDWSVSSKTCFTNVRCDYIYRKCQDGQPSDRYPVGRDFESGEFATLFAEPEDIVELVFKGEFDYAALSLALYKLQSEASDLDLELKGIEQRGNLWVVKVKSGNHEINERLVEERLSSVYQVASHGETIEETIKDSIYRDYEETKNRLAESERLVRQLAGVSENQAEALKEITRKSLGNNFFISGSTITNLAGSGQIEYREAADRVRSIVTNQADASPMIQQLFGHLSTQKIATTAATQQELIQQILLSEAEQDPTFRQFLLEQGQQIVGSLPSGEIVIALQSAITQLSA